MSWTGWKASASLIQMFETPPRPDAKAFFRPSAEYAAFPFVLAASMSGWAGD